MFSNSIKLKHRKHILGNCGKVSIFMCSSLPITFEKASDDLKQAVRSTYHFVWHPILIPCLSVIYYPFSHVLTGLAQTNHVLSQTYFCFRAFGGKKKQANIHKSHPLSVLMEGMHTASTLDRESLESSVIARNTNISTC